MNAPGYFRVCLTASDEMVERVSRRCTGSRAISRYHGSGFSRTSGVSCSAETRPKSYCTSGCSRQACSTGATFTNASTTAGSKCVPRPLTMKATTSSCCIGPGRRGASGPRRTRPLTPSRVRQSGSPCRAALRDTRSRPTFRGGCRRCPWRWSSVTSSRTPTSRSAFRMTSRPCTGCLRISTSSSAVSAPGLFSRLSGTPDLADVVQRRQRRQQIDALRRQIGGVFGMRASSCARTRVYCCVRRECLPGLGVPDFGQRQQRLDHQAL